MKNNDEMEFDEIYEERQPKFNESINIAIVGKVSTGKSSLINAILLRDRTNPVAEVGAKSGVTTDIKAFKLDENVLIIDSPGLDDIRKENSKETENFLKNVDLGIMVVSGSADFSQKRNFDDLRKHSNKVLVVLNKVDEWDGLDESALLDVTEQWKSELGVDHVYATCTKGFDPRMKKDAPMDLRGIESLNEDIWGYLQKEGKDLLLARHLGDKRKYAAGIIAGALSAVAVEAFIPGSAVYITATQAVAITSLNYLYTGERLNKSSALTLLPTFAGESLGGSIFLWAKSFLPPTVVVDVAAAGIAMVITFAMLAAVTYILSSGFEIEQKEMLKEKFNEYQKSSAGDFKEKIIKTVKEGGSIKDIIYRFLFV